ncbi:hypothetical protein HPB47_014000 [Ixodes persulcatus]|uniref:Uncharacterized protein n=1 Tax=Ixodes persulcatus TaxID=34615 RepID=A0AC60QX33_IXOPE|nr:hypothetical protein HPB47_014000 [Ixodes persulcatus]
MRPKSSGPVDVGSGEKNVNKTGYDPGKVAFDFINPAARPLSTDGIQKTASEEQPELSNAQIKEKTKAPGHEILDARRLGRSKSALVTFAGTKVPFTVMFNWLEMPCFLYKKTKAACLNCREAGHRTDVSSKPTGYACAMCGAAQAMEGHPCVPKCALCGGAHKTYDSHCPEKFFKEKRN